jgi:homoserine dehydrogenase
LQLDLVLVGFGNVARRFVSLLSERRATLRRDYDVTARIVGIATRNHGCVFDPHGLRAARLLRLRSPGSHASEGGTLSFIRDATRRCAAAAREGRLVVIETTTLNIESGQPAIDHVRTALEGRAHVVTANKGPAAFAHDDLAAAAARAERRFLFEGAVMDGIPIFNLVRETLPSVTITGFRGVVNSTTNFMLTAMEEGQSFDAALAEMQARGIAEADASLDVDGWDAAAKTAALANVLMDARMTPHDVVREGISAATGEAAVQARAAGRRLKLVVAAARANGRVTARVAPAALPGDDLLAGVEGQQNALVLQTDLLDEIAIVQRGGSLTQTAYGLLSDLIAIARATPPPRRSAPRRRTPSRRGRR